MIHPSERQTDGRALALCYMLSRAKTIEFYSYSLGLRLLYVYRAMQVGTCMSITLKLPPLSLKAWKLYLI